MFRRFFPKGTDLDVVPDEDISAVQDWMNNYPRKLLGGKTAGMLFDEFVASLSWKNFSDFLKLTLAIYERAL